MAESMLLSIWFGTLRPQPDWFRRWKTVPIDLKNHLFLMLNKTKGLVNFSQIDQEFRYEARINTVTFSV